MHPATPSRILFFAVSLTLLFPQLSRAMPPLEECTPLTSAPFVEADSKSLRTQIGRDFDSAAHSKVVATDAVIAVLEKAAKKKPLPCEPYLGTFLAFRATMGELSLRARLSLLERAASKLSSSSKHFPTDSYLLARLSYVQELLGLFTEAAATRRAALKLDASDRNYSSLVRLFTLANNHAQARDVAREWAEKLPTHAAAHVALGVALEAEGDVKNALLAYGKAVDFYRDGDTGAILQGTLLAKLGRWEEADIVFTDVDGPDTPLALYSRAICRDRMGLLVDSFRLEAKLQETGHQVLIGLLAAYRSTPREVAPLLGYGAYHLPYGEHELSPSIE
jgi:tetratricopeptide (TPR) repeat protein